MSKRNAEVQITKDNFNTESKVETGKWVCASKEQISKRKMVKVRRKSGTCSKPSTPVSKYPSFNLTNQTPELKKEPENAFAKLIDPNTWECEICLVRNKKVLAKCAACESPNPQLQSNTKDNDSKSNTSNISSESPFTFGSGNDSNPTDSVKNSSDASNGNIFTFGSGDDKPAESAKGFSFGSAAANTPASGFSFTSSDTFTFGSGSPGSVAWGGKTTSYAWGGSAPTSTTDSSTESTEKSSVLFQFSTHQSLVKSTENTSEKSAFQPIEDQKSGEEKDKLLHKIHTKVYTLKQVPIVKPTEIGDMKKDASPPKMKDKYVESGSGDLRINVREDDGKTQARMVLRVDKTQRLVLNAPIFPEMLFNIEGEKYIRFTSNDLNGDSAVFLLRFRNQTESSEVYSYIQKCISMIKTNRQNKDEDEDKEDEEDEEESQV